MLPDSDRRKIEGLVRDGAEALAEEPAFERGAAGGFVIGDWKCDLTQSTFHKTFAFDGRRYRLRGRFVRSWWGAWRAEVTRLSRLLTLEECRAAGASGCDCLASGIELALDPEDARQALLRWLRTGDYAEDFASFRGGVAEVVTRDLASPETLEKLACAPVEAGDPYCQIGEWAVCCDDREFQKVIPSRAGSVPMGLVGHFDLTPGCEWRPAPSMLSNLIR